MRKHETLVVFDIIPNILITKNPTTTVLGQFICGGNTYFYCFLFAIPRNNTTLL